VRDPCWIWGPLCGGGAEKKGTRKGKGGLGMESKGGEKGEMKKREDGRQRNGTRGCGVTRRGSGPPG